VSVRTAVFASGGGSNLQALIDRFATASEVDIVLVVSDRADAGALRRAETAGIRARHIAVRGRPPHEVAAETTDALHAHGVELIALAGYLRLVPADVTRSWRGRILNIHPALLPSFGGQGMYGLRVHEAVLAAGCAVTGATVHLVDERYDEGRILAQWPVPVLAADTPERLAARVLAVEHQLYPAVVAALARRLRDGTAVQQEATDAASFRLTREAASDGELAAVINLDRRA
jgi:phosphoribosylglycinamide formyltransferase 1